MSSVYVSLSLFNQGVYGCPFHVFSKSLFQLGSPLILVTAPELTGFSYSYFRTSWNIEAFSLCFVFTSTKSPRGPPWNEGHRPKVHHETSVLEVPAQEQHEHSFCSSSSTTFITCFLYTVHRYRTSPGAPDLWRGWADPKAVHRMECSGAHSLYWRSLSVGATAGSVPYCQYKEVCLPTRPNAKQANELSTTTDPRSCARAVYIAGDTLHHQQMGAGHMMVLQLHGPMAFHVLQWCCPMLA